MKRFITLAIVAMVAAILGAFALQGTAHAEQSDCQSGQVCTWQDADYEDGLYYYTSPGWGKCINLGPGWNDNTFSIMNKFSADVFFFKDHGCTGTWGAPFNGPIKMAPGQARSIGNEWNNYNISSFRWYWA